jgi:hypothetical protein
VTVTGEPDVVFIGDFNADGSCYNESAFRLPWMRNLVADLRTFVLL